MSDNSIVGLKVGFIFGILIVTFISGFVPIKWDSCRKNQTALSVANTFGGGVFLAIAFMHLIPETMEQYHNMQYSDLNSLYLEDEHDHGGEESHEGEEELEEHSEEGHSEEEHGEEEHGEEEHGEEHGEEEHGEEEHGEEEHGEEHGEEEHGEEEHGEEEHGEEHGEEEHGEEEHGEEDDHDHEEGETTATFYSMIKTADTSAEMEELIHEYVEHSQDSFPVPYILVLIGYTLILLLDKVVAQSSHHGHSDADHLHHQRLAKEDAHQDNQLKQETQPANDMNQKEGQNVYTGQRFQEEQDIEKVGHKKPLEDEESNAENFVSDMEERREFPQKNTEVVCCKGTSSKTHQQENEQFESEVRSYLNRNDVVVRQINCELERRATRDHQEHPKNEKDEDQHEVEVQTGLCHNCSLISLVLLIALSAHALLAGLAMGLASNYQAAVNIVIALVTHKVPASISLGVSLAKNFSNQKQAILLVAFFSVVTPVGTAIGMGIKNSNDFVEIFFNAISAGTFIYIGASEIIVEEFSVKGPYNWARLASFAAGIALVTCLGLLDNHDH